MELKYSCPAPPAAAVAIAVVAVAVIVVVAAAAAAAAAVGPMNTSFPHITAAGTTKIAEGRYRGCGGTG